MTTRDGFTAQNGTARSDDTVDQGLRAQYLKVYNLLLAGIAVTATTALLSFQTGFTDMLYGNHRTSLLGMAFMVAPLAYAFLIGGRSQSASPTKLRFWYWSLTAIFGVSLSVYGLAYEPTSIVGSFVATVAAFSGLSIYGYVTKRDLAGIGAFMFMALWGLIAAMVVNMIMQSSIMDYVVSFAAIAIFSVLTAWDTQKIRREYDLAHSSVELERLAVGSALGLYLDFINLFVNLLRIFGVRTPGRD